MADYAFFEMFWTVAKVVLTAVAILLFVLLTWWVKVAVRSIVARRMLLIFLVVFFFSGMAGVVWYARFQSPRRIVERTKAIPLSGSIRLLHGHENSGLESDEVWLHFSMSPRDFDEIISSGSYAVLADFNLNYNAYGPPPWWRVGRLGQNPGCYLRLSGPMRGYDDSAMYLIVNHEHTEALVLARYWYK